MASTAPETLATPRERRSIPSPCVQTRGVEELSDKPHTCHMSWAWRKESPARRDGASREDRGGFRPERTEEVCVERNRGRSGKLSPQARSPPTVTGRRSELWGSRTRHCSAEDKSPPGVYGDSGGQWPFSQSPLDRGGHRVRCISKMTASGGEPDYAM